MSEPTDQTTTEAEGGAWLGRRLRRLPRSRWLPAALTLVLICWAAWQLFIVAPDVRVALVGTLVLIALWLFTFEVFPTDVAALFLLILLGLGSWVLETVFDLRGLIPLNQTFSGFGGNAVISILAAMIIASGLDRAGMMEGVVERILTFGGEERRVMLVICIFAAAVSSFMPNAGAAAMFLPVVSRISSRTGIAMSRLLIPMAFSVIAGGTITMIGSSSLIVVNDLLGAYRSAETHGLNLFSPLPAGVAATFSIIAFFYFYGYRLLPKGSEKRASVGTMDYLRRTYGLSYGLNEIYIPEQSKALGSSIGDLEAEYAIRIVAVSNKGKIHLAPGSLARDTAVVAGNLLAVMGSEYATNRFCEETGLVIQPVLTEFADVLTQSKAGIAELVITPTSRLVDSTIRDTWLRKTYGLTCLAIHRGRETITDQVIDVVLQSGDTLVCHTAWESLPRVENDRDMVLITTEYPRRDFRANKVPWAIGSAALGLTLAIFGNMPVSLALMTGAATMVLTGVLRMDEAYNAVSWRTIFLLACLIPLGKAVGYSGAGGWVADMLANALSFAPQWVILVGAAVLATFLSLVMSNVGAAVLLLPIAVNIGIQSGADVSLVALIVAVCTNNAFLIPTNQVNVMIQAPGGYRNVDFLRTGSFATALFFAAVLLMFEFFGEMWLAIL
ncbi:SLC13 family permease [Gammaproteobacteria bacterium]|nr:SLC13 family permease [Gammaproteobacteria bacterium]